MKQQGSLVGKSIILDPQCSLEDGVAYHGNDIPGSAPIKNVPTPEACCDLCKQHSLCIIFGWDKDDNNCWLKHTEGLRSIVKLSIAGKPGKRIQKW